jgi:hypothetical protein
MEDPVSKLSKDIRNETIEITEKASSNQDLYNPKIEIPASQMRQAAEGLVKNMLANEQTEL